MAQYDGTLRTSNGQVVQFLYGGWYGRRLD
jgi:hypothetical protein